MVDVLDHGEVILVDSMANDWKVVDAARISTGKVSESAIWPGVHPDWSDRETKLINYLMSNGHGTPFEHAVFQFYIKAPLFVVREWQRHRIASYNEFSKRYAVAPDEFYVPNHVRVQDPANKQSSVRLAFDESDTPANRAAVAKQTAFQLRVEHQSRLAYDLYSQMLDAGIAREMARMVLPVNIYTKFWFTVNARSLMNFLMLRNAQGAQWEIRQYAHALEDIFSEKMPVTYAAFVDNGRRAP